jgi:hypothetical protein
MLRFIALRLALSVALTSTLLPAASFAQSQNSQSVADAARRARAQKKKPAKVITEDDVKPAAPASSDQAAAPGAPTSPSAGGASSAPAGSAAPGPNDEKNAKEIVGLKAQIKQAQSDLDLLQRQLSLEQDNYFSKPDYTHDTAGKTKVDGIKQQVSDKQQELDGLKARLAELQPGQPAPPAAPPKS